jgi:hypothetical protein
MIVRGRFRAQIGRMKVVLFSDSCIYIQAADENDSAAQE